MNWLKATVLVLALASLGAGPEEIIHVNVNGKVIKVIVRRVNPQRSMVVRPRLNERPRFRPIISQKSLDEAIRDGGLGPRMGMY